MKSALTPESSGSAGAWKRRFPGRCFQGVLLLSLLLSLCACTVENFMLGISMKDWIYSDLPNGYYVMRSNGRNIFLGRKEEKGDFHVLDSYISYLGCVDGYILAQQVAVPEENSTPIDLSDPVFYIVDTRDDTIYGPYGEDTFEEACSDLAIGQFSWIPTTDLPKLTSEQ